MRRIGVSELNAVVDEWLDKNKPDYLRVSDRVSYNALVEFKCKRHPNPLVPWKTTFPRLKTGVPCPECNPSNKKKIDNTYIDLWLSKNANNYTRVGDYVNAKTSIDLFCKKHNKVVPVVWDTFRKYGRCKECYKSGRFVPRKVNNSFLDSYLSNNLPNIERLSDCSGADKITKFRCKLDGYVWETSYNTLKHCHEIGTKGCPKCSNVAVKTNKDVDDYLIGDERGYVRKSNVSGAYGYIQVECPIHGEWSITTTNLLRGRGCPYCPKHGFNKSKPAFLYYVNLNGVYKIGITSNKVKYRVKKQHDNYKIICVAKFSVGADAYNAEQYILKKYADRLVDGRNYGVTDGWTETFSVDVLNSRLDDVLLEFLEDVGCH